MTNNRLEQAYQDIGLFWISAVQLALTRGILNFNLIFPDRKQLSSSLTDFCLFFKILPVELKGYMCQR